MTTCRKTKADLATANLAAVKTALAMLTTPIASHGIDRGIFVILNANVSTLSSTLLDKAYKAAKTPGTAYGDTAVAPMAGSTTIETPTVGTT